MPQPTLPVAVFAHNEERHITACLDSVHAPGLRPYVLVNGCTDGTERLVRDLARTRDLEVVTIAAGDKANAWNVFVHEIAARADACVFLDGDVVAAPGACEALARTLAAHPDANAAAAVPQSGRDRPHMTRLVMQERLVLGNLYALSGSFLDRLRASRIRVPVGVVFEDGWVTSMAKWNADPAGDWQEARVEPCPGAVYTYESFSPARPSDIRKYWRRKVRYSVGRFQHLLLRDCLTAGGLAAMPASVADLYQPDAVDRLRIRPGEFLFDWLALRRMRQAWHARPARSS